MKSVVIFLFILLVQSFDLSSCSCYDSRELDKIQSAIRQYKNEAERNFFWEVPLNSWAPWTNLPREKWEYPYHENIENLNTALLYEDVSRYPIIYHNILIFDQKIDVMASYSYEKAYMSYFGPNVGPTRDSQAEKESKVEKERVFARKCEKRTRDELDNLHFKITNIYLKLHEECIKKHISLQTYRDYGLLTHLNNNYEIAFEMLHGLIEEAEKTGQLEFLDFKFYHELGSVCVEAMQYNNAIDYLSESIRKNPQNKAAYFDRAIAYFETGSFDLALDDYVSSDKGEFHFSQVIPISAEFTNALLTSTFQGVSESIIDYVPSMCSSVYGMGEALWVTAEHPIETTQQFVNACQEISECMNDYCKNLEWETIEGYADGIKEKFKNYIQLNDREKGELIGYIIGRYGIEIFAGGAIFKTAKAYRNLKNANRVCNLESMIVSNANKEALVSSACKHAAEREAYLKSVKIHWGKQEKHIVGKNNYQPGNSILEHNDPESLIIKFAGKGKKVNKEVFGNPGYKEIVECNEHVGRWIDINNKLELPTTKCTIHYAKDGVHIVPAYPYSKVK